MYQIKFLKPVTVKANQIKLVKPVTLGRVNGNSARASNKNDTVYEISSAVTISNDLGEQFFYGRVELDCELRSYTQDDVNDSTQQVIAKKQISWTAGKRAVDVKFEVPARYLHTGKFIALHVFADERLKVVDGLNTSEVTHEELRQDWFPRFKELIVDCQNSIDLSSDKLQLFPSTSSLLKLTEDSAAFPIKSDRVAIRRIADVVLLEELSGEIARHLWDAGIIVNSLSREELLAFLFDNSSSEVTEQNFQILELGTGIGLVSLHLSKIFTQADILATDLIDAKEICDLNIGLNYAEGKVKFAELDWEEQADPLKSWDVIITTDCTYNPTYYDALLNVLKRESNKNTKIVLAHKFREPLSESEFFEKVQKDFKLKKQLWYNSQGQSLTHIGLYSLR